MLDFFNHGLFSTELSDTITFGSFLLCMVCSLLIGQILALSCRYQGRYTKSFQVTLMLLPTVVCVIIMMVNGSVGAGPFRAGYGPGDYHAVSRHGCGIGGGHGVSCLCTAVCPRYVRHEYAVQ